MTPLVREMIGLAPDAVPDAVWFDGGILPRKLPLNIRGSLATTPLPFDLPDVAQKLQRENAELRTKIAEMEKQEPVAWMCSDKALIQMGYKKFSDRCEGSWDIPVFAGVPGAQSAPSVPAAALKPVIAWLRNGCDPQEAAKELDMLIAAAPEAKP